MAPHFEMINCVSSNYSLINLCLHTGALSYQHVHFAGQELIRPELVN